MGEMSYCSGGKMAIKDVGDGMMPHLCIVVLMCVSVGACPRPCLKTGLAIAMSSGAG